MKTAVSVSLGNKIRDHKSIVTLLGQEVEIRREGTDGDTKEAKRLFTEYDGKVDALGVGGTDLLLRVDKRFYKLHGAWKLIKNVKTTPIVDGNGLKNTLEKQLGPFLLEHFDLEDDLKKVFIASALDRYGMCESFVDAGFECVFGDLMFALGLPFKIKTLKRVRILARLLMPIAGRLPLSFIYPTGESQLENTPKFKKWFNWASVIAGDFNYIRKYAPLDMTDKIIVTNTTTSEDLVFLKERGVKTVITSTPDYEGRTFGTNALEAAFTAVSNKGRPLTDEELSEIIQKENIRPTLRNL